MFEIGPSTSNGMGEDAISWSEIEAWQRVSGVQIKSWEGRLLRDLSRDFVAARHAARDPNCPPPYDPIAADPVKAAHRLDQQFGAMLRAFATYVEKRDEQGESL